MKQLPVEFQERMKTLLGDEYDDFLKSYDEKPVRPINEKLMFNVIKAAFLQRRKTLSNAVSHSDIGVSKDVIGDILEEQCNTRWRKFYKRPCREVLLIAEEQTNGRGTKGRSFFS